MIALLQRVVDDFYQGHIVISEDMPRVGQSNGDRLLKNVPAQKFYDCHICANFSVEFNP